MNSYKPILFVLFLSVLLFSCRTKINIGPQTSGTANFYNYVALGNSLTAGYEDGGLYQEGQINSYPNIIAGQLHVFNNSGFVQPLFGPGQQNGSGFLHLAGFTASGNPILDTVNTNLAIVGAAKSAATGQLQYLYAPTSSYTLNNWGVPGIRLSDILTPGYGSSAGNPYFQRLLPASQTYATYQQVVVATKPTFFTCWLGNNDVLGYATSGGTVPITPPATFQALYTQLMSAMLANGSNGAVGTIPDVTLIPYLNTITVAKVSAMGGGAPVWITTGTGTIRQATSADLINLTVAGIGVKNALGAPKGFSQYNPLLNSEVLDASEVQTAKATVASYNASINQIAAQDGLAVMDINALLNQFINGGEVDGIPLNLNYITGGIFSLDGVHLTPRGYAVVANAWISAINAKFGSSIALVNVADYRGVKFPN